MADNRSFKRPRGSSPELDENVGKSDARGPLCFAQFLALPEEIRSIILDLTCNLPCTSANAPTPRSTGSVPPLDVPTTINLACTSRWFYLRTATAIWRDIKITRPSALASLQRALAARPQLGRLVKSLYVGPDRETPESHQRPLRWQHSYTDAQGIHHPAMAFIATSFGAEEDAKFLPAWCSPGQEWSVEHTPAGRKSAAVFRAVRAAQEGLGFDLTRQSRNWEDPQLYELQAALDLYLIKMRQIEADSPAQRQGSDKEDTVYPPLLLINPSTSPNVEAGHYVLTRRHLLEHLARPGAATDSFDHHLLFERSGFDTRELWHTSGLRRWSPGDRLTDQPEDLADVFTSEGLGGLAEPKEGSLDFLDPAMASAPTTGSLLGLLRCVLALVPRIENLALTGFLERAVCGRRPFGLVLKSLRFVSLGPPPALQWWFAPLNFDGLREGINELRICGIMLRGDELETVKGKQTVWTVPDDLKGKELLKLGVLIDHFAGRKSMAADAALRELGFDELHSLKLPFSYSALDKDPVEEEHSRRDYGYGTFIEIRLLPSVLKAMLDRAANDGEREDWVKGRGCHCQQRRLLLSEIPVRGKSVSESKVRQAMYDEGVEWWEKHRRVEKPSWQGYRA